MSIENESKAVAVKGDTGVAAYEPYTPEQAERDEQSLNRRNVPYMKGLKDGDNVLRILPGFPGKSPFRTVAKHWIEVPGIVKKVVFVCPRVEARLPCPVCAEAKKLADSGNRADYDLAKGMWPTTSSLCNVIDRDDEAAGVQVATLAKTVHAALVEIRKNVRVGADFTDPEHGYDVIVHKDPKKKQGSPYTVMLAREATALADTPEQVEEWLRARVDLELGARVPTIEEIRGLLSGRGREDGPPMATDVPFGKPTEGPASGDDSDPLPF